MEAFSQKFLYSIHIFYFFQVLTSDFFVRTEAEKTSWRNIIAWYGFYGNFATFNFFSKKPVPNRSSLVPSGVYVSFFLHFSRSCAVAGRSPRSFISAMNSIQCFCGCPLGCFPTLSLSNVAPVVCPSFCRSTCPYHFNLCLRSTSSIGTKLAFSNKSAFLTWSLRIFPWSHFSIFASVDRSRTDSLTRGAQISAPYTVRQPFWHLSAVVKDGHFSPVVPGGPNPRSDFIFAVFPLSVSRPGSWRCVIFWFSNIAGQYLHWLLCLCSNTLFCLCWISNRTFRALKSILRVVPLLQNKSCQGFENRMQRQCLTVCPTRCVLRFNPKWRRRAEPWWKPTSILKELLQPCVDYTRLVQFLYISCRILMYVSETPFVCSDDHIRSLGTVQCHGLSPCQQRHRGRSDCVGWISPSRLGC